MATTVSSSVASDIARYPRAFPAGVTIDFVSLTVATTSIDTIADRVRLIPMRGSRRILGMFLEHGDMDGHMTPLLDMDLVLEDDETSDTVLFNAGTGFQSARTTPLWITPQASNKLIVTNAPGNDAFIGTYVNAAAATAAAVNLTLTVFHEGRGAD